MCNLTMDIHIQNEQTNTNYVSKKIAATKDNVSIIFLDPLIKTEQNER